MRSARPSAVKKRAHAAPRQKKRIQIAPAPPRALDDAEDVSLPALAAFRVVRRHGFVDLRASGPSLGRDDS
jgi:hypothetical protein